ncbi:MAG: hypothetical protein Q8914_07890 [Bacteroidota bacterium]|nr:hypothetical protein [Bacteroidota bacterium]
MTKNVFHEYTLPIGLVALSLGLILKQFFDKLPWIQFTEGFLFGLSIVFIIFHLITVKRKRKDEETN